MSAVGYCQICPKQAICRRLAKVGWLGETKALAGQIAEEVV